MVASAYPEYHLDWCRNLVSVIADGGLWAVPRSNLVFRANKTDKTLTLVAGDPCDDDVVESRNVFALIGWRVLTQ